jgi:hypothetical protein
MGDTVVRSVALNPNLDSVIEETRSKLGMNRSAFYKYAVLKLLQELSVLTEIAHKEVAESG